MCDLKRKYITFKCSPIDCSAQDKSEFTLLRNELFDLMKNLLDYRSTEKIKYFVFELGIYILFSMMLLRDIVKLILILMKLP
ncbi:MAG: hypothetical protein Q4F97_12460 [Bacteroidales bacterium]|nr:hypothetical protein [Bacteroidales bacterium]